MKQSLVYFSVILFFYSISYSQEKYKKNAIYGNFGTVGVVSAVGINYERLINKPSDNFLSSYWLKFGYGTIEAGFDSFERNNYYSVSLTALTSLKKNHGEFNIGVVGLDLIDKESLTKSNDFRIRPVFAVGYRYQKPKGGIMFRSGIGYPEIVYIGLGYTF